MSYVVIERFEIGGETKMISHGVIAKTGFWFFLNPAPTIFETKEEIQIEIYKYKKIRNDIMKQKFHEENFKGIFKKAKKKYWRHFKIEIKEVK